MLSTDYVSQLFFIFFIVIFFLLIFYFNKLWRMNRKGDRDLKQRLELELKQFKENNGEL